MSSYADQHDIASQLLATKAMASTALTAAGGGDNTEVDGDTLDITPTGMSNRPHSVAFLVVMQATLAAAKHLSVETTLQYRTGASTWNDVTGAANIAHANLLTGGGGGTTERGVLKVGLNLSKLPVDANAVRIQVKPDLDATGTDTGVVTACAVFGGLNEYPAV